MFEKNILFITKFVIYAIKPFPNKYICDYLKKPFFPMDSNRHLPVAMRFLRSFSIMWQFIVLYVSEKQKNRGWMFLNILKYKI